MRQGLSRRTFLKGSSLTVAAASLAGSVPGLTSFLSEGSAEAPEIDGAASETAGESQALTETVVVHLKDLNTGEMSIYSGEQEISYRDSQLASRIARAMR